MIALALYGVARARELEVIDSDPTILRYYRDCGRTDVKPLGEVPPDDPGFDEALARWQQDAEALEGMLVRYGIQMVEAAIDARVDDRTCRKVDFAEGVGTALTANHLLWPSAAPPTRVFEAVDAGAPPREPWRRPAWAWVAGAGGLLCVGVGGAGWLAAHDGVDAAGASLAAARATQDARSREASEARIHEGRALEAAGAAGAGIGLGVAVLAWTVRW